MIMMKKRGLLLLLLLSLSATLTPPPVEAQETPFTYFEYPTETWIIEKQDYFGQFLEWAFVPVEGQHGDKRGWNFTWTQRDFLEVYNDTTGDIVESIENPILRLRRGESAEEIYEEVGGLGGFENWGDFKSDVSRLNKYPIVPEDKEDFTGLHTDIDILNHDQGWFLVSFKDNWKLGKKITIGFGSTVTYNGGDNIITVTGGAEGSEIDFWDIWNASNVNGWNVVSNNNGTNYQFEFNCKIVLGDGATPTYFNDTNKQITFLDGILTGNNQYFIEVKASATLTLGTVGSTVYTAKDGVSILSLEQTWNYQRIGCSSTSGKMYLYGCTFQGWDSTHSINIMYPTRVYSCLLSYTGIYFIKFIHSEIYDVILLQPYFALYDIYGTIDRVYHHGGGTYGVVTVGAVNVVVSNYIQNPASISSIRVFDLTGSLSLIDCELAAWTISWGGTSTGPVNRQYTFNVAVVDSLGNPVENADVTLTHSGQGGGTDYTGETPVNGSIPEQTISKGFYNQTGGNTIYPIEPYNVTVTATGYQTQTFIFNVSAPLDWRIPLTLVEDGLLIQNINAFNIELLVFSALAGIFMFIGWFNDDSRGLVASVLSFFVWFATGLWWLWDKAPTGTMDFFYIFEMLALVALITVAYKTMTLYKSGKKGIDSF